MRLGTQGRRFALSFSGLVSLILATGAAAADPPAATDSQPVTKLEDVEVTAQRRSEKLSEVPVAVTAISRDQIEQRAITSLTDLDGMAPGLQISKTPSNTTISQITIRGSSQINPAIYWDPAVGVYLDGVYIGKAQGSVFDVVDLERVEVLRGPQGTLYGRNTIGGTVNLWSRESGNSFGGSAGLEVGNYSAILAKASVDMPVSDSGSLTLAGRVERRDGWVETTPGSSVSELNDRNNQAFRAAARFEVSPAFEVSYAFDWSDVDQINNFDQLYRADLPDLQPYVHTERQDTASVDAPSFERSRVSGHALTLSWNLGDNLTLKSITGYRKLRWEDSLDLDGSPGPVAFTQRFTDYDQTSQDLNLTGGMGDWKYVVGAYYFADDGYTNNPQNFFAGMSTFDSRYGTETSAWALYGQVDWHFAPMWTAAAGVRYTREDKDLERVFGCNQAAIGNPNCTPGPGESYVYLIPEGTTASGDFDATTPMVSLRYQPEDNLNVYLRYAEGFKSGGFNGEFSDTAASSADNIAETQTPFRPEKQKSLELGLKTDFADKRVQLGAALFHNELEDLQASIFLGSGAAATVVRNAGEGTVNGLELETAFIVMPGTTLRLNYTYLDAEYDEFIDAGTNQADNRAFVHTPENAFNALLDSELMRTENLGVLRGVVDYVWTDDFYTYPYQLDGSNPNAQVAANSQVEAHGVLNLRLGLVGIPVGRSSNAEIALWCRNALDDDTATNFIDFGPGFGNLTVANFEEPRTFGIAGMIRF